MANRVAKFVAVLILVGIALGLVMGPVSAATPDGTSPDSALYPSGEWKTLQPGEVHWYAFRDEGKAAQVLLELKAEPANGATFEVWTEDQLHLWSLGQEFAPLGVGSHNQFTKSQIWSGNFYTKGDCVVMVKNTSALPSTYMLRIAGKDLSPTPAQFVPSPEVAVTPPEAAVERAIEPIDDMWMPLEAGERHVFAFQYKGDNSDILIELKEDVVGRATFAVYTPDQWARKMNGEKVEPVGRGSADAGAPHSRIWAGNFPFKGTFYVEVTHTPQAGTAHCMLRIFGQGIY